MKYDEAINKVLYENYFGGSPYEQATGIKRHITFVENTTPLARQLQDAFDEVAPYYSRDPEDIGRWQEYAGGRNSRKPEGQYVENPKAQDEHDEIVKELLGDSELMKVDIEEGGSYGPVHVYALRDERLVDGLKPLGLLALSLDDHGMETSVGPLDQWYSLMIGQKAGDRLGSFTNLDGDLIRRNKPILVNKGGEKGRLYSGPADSLKNYSNKEPEASRRPEADEDIGEPEENLSPVQQAIAAQNNNPIDTSKYML